VAHRPPPAILLSQAATPAEAESGDEPTCPTTRPVSVAQAVIAVKDDWAEARVPHCGPGSRHDEFRLIRFAGRWRFVFIHLSPLPVHVTER
jgi:hypothetical protein